MWFWGSKRANDGKTLESQNIRQEREPVKMTRIQNSNTSKTTDHLWRWRGGRKVSCGKWRSFSRTLNLDLTFDRQNDRHEASVRDACPVDFTL
jgi:hypothetical protein